MSQRRQACSCDFVTAVHVRALGSTFCLKGFLLTCMRLLPWLWAFAIPLSRLLPLASPLNSPPGSVDGVAHPHTHSAASSWTSTAIAGALPDIHHPNCAARGLLTMATTLLPAPAVVTCVSVEFRAPHACWPWRAPFVVTASNLCLDFLSKDPWEQRRDALSSAQMTTKRGPSWPCNCTVCRATATPYLLIIVFERPVTHGVSHLGVGPR